MKKIYLIVFTFALVFFTIRMSAQEALHNFGNLKIHTEGALGFHYNLINDGIFDDNQGLAGFFSNDRIEINGAFRPTFRDIDVMVTNNLFLNIGIGVTNHINFILGDIITPRLSKDITINYINNGFYSSDDNFRKIDGYSELTNKQNFIFPIGYENSLRALGINSATTIPNAKSAYFHENPNSPLNFEGEYKTTTKTAILSEISTYEFWDLESSAAVSVDLKWNEKSNLSAFVDHIDNLRVVGWHTTNKEWENLGGLTISGDLNSGQISSDVFIPDDYTIISFGSSMVINNVNLGNYYVSANDDGMNDFLSFEEIALSPNNELKIYSRWGRLVYSKKNYDNTFSGKSNVNMVLKKDSNLPDGVYFYIIELHDLDIEHQGFLYLFTD